MAKAKPRKPAIVVPMPPVQSLSVRGNQPETVTESDIARRAFAIYCERGSQHGHDLDDWLQAERELRALVQAAVA
jgi:hypothetical protein